MTGYKRRRDAVDEETVAGLYVRLYVLVCTSWAQ